MKAARGGQKQTKTIVEKTTNDSRLVLRKCGGQKEVTLHFSSHEGRNCHLDFYSGQSYPLGMKKK